MECSNHSQSLWKTTMPGLLIMRSESNVGILHKNIDIVVSRYGKLPQE